MKTIAFARGVPAPEMIPVENLKQATDLAYERNATSMLSYGDGAGFLPLRQQIAKKHKVAVEQVVITTGSLQGFFLFAQVIARKAHAEGRIPRAIVEQPTYDRPLLILKNLGFEVISIPLNSDGIDIGQLENYAANADFIYLIPTYQNPSGSLTSLEKREQIIDIARKKNLLVLEDDPYGELYFDQSPPPQIFTLVEHDPLFLLSESASKTVAPGLRVGWMVLPAELASEVAQQANNEYISASFLGQATLNSYLELGFFDKNVLSIREMLLKRRDIMLSAIGEHMEDVQVSAPQGGYFIWLKLPPKIKGSSVIVEAKKYSTTAVAGESFGDREDSYLRLAFSSPPESDLEEGIKRLSLAIKELRSSTIF